MKHLIIILLVFVAFKSQAQTVLLDTQPAQIKMLQHNDTVVYNGFMLKQRLGFTWHGWPYLDSKYKPVYGIVIHVDLKEQQTKKVDTSDSKPAYMHKMKML